MISSTVFLCLIAEVTIKNIAKFTGKHLCQSLFFNSNFIKKETLTQVFSCESCNIFKNTFLQNTSGRLLLTGQNSDFIDKVSMQFS